MQRYIYIIALAIFGLISCQRDDLILSPSVDYGEEVAVNLNFAVDGLEPATDEAKRGAMTRANGATSNDLAGTAVQNLWIIQFDGVEEDSEAIVAHYLTGDMSTVNLLPMGRATTVVAIANTFEPGLMPMPLRMTIGEFKKKHRTIVANTDSNKAFYGAGVVSLGDDDKPYFVLNDCCDVEVLANGTIKNVIDNTTHLYPLPLNAM